MKHPVTLAMVTLFTASSVTFRSHALAQVVALHYEPPDTKLLTTHEEDAFERIFETTHEQRNAVSSLVSGAKSQVMDAERKARDIEEAFRKLPKDEQTPTAREAMRTRHRAVEPHPEVVRAQLLADMKAVLTEAQAERWKKFEYFLRREKDITTYTTGWGRDKTNVLALVDALDLSAAERATIADLMDGYERDLDAALIDLEAQETKLDDALSQARSAGADLASARDEAAKPFRESARRLTQLNIQYVRRIGAQLPDRAAALHKLYDQVSLHEAFHADDADLAIRSATELPDLEQSKQEAIRKIVDDYSRQYDALSEKIAAMERHIRGIDTSDPTADTSQWDTIRRERGSLMSKTQREILPYIGQDGWNSLYQRGRERGNVQRATMSR